MKYLRCSQTIVENEKRIFKWFEAYGSTGKGMTFYGTKMRNL